MSAQEPSYLSKALNITIRLGVLVFIFWWCFEILAPFISPIISAIIIAVALHPLYDKLQKRLKGRRKLAASLVTVLFLTLLIVPAWLLADSMIEGVREVRDAYEAGNLTIPPPGDNVKEWPVFAKPIVDLWKIASHNIGDLFTKYSAEVKSAGKVLFEVVEKTGIGILSLMVSIIISGFLLYYSEHGGNRIEKLFTRLGGEHGTHFVELSGTTIRNVVKGVIGVAVIQSLMCAIGFVIAGVPLPGLWTLICLILAIVQIGIGPVALGVIIYMYATADPLPATLLTLWLIFITVIDNFLKPLMMGGTKIPTLIVFLGSLGGFVANGFMGLFLGPVILSIGYALFRSWLDEVNYITGEPKP